MYSDGTNDYDSVADFNALSFASGNVMVVPGFVDAANGNYRLNANSPLKGLGLNGSIQTPAWDFEGGFVDHGGGARGSSWAIGGFQ